MGKKHDKEWINKKTIELLNLSDLERLDMIKRAVSLLNSMKEKFVISMLYVYGMRPAELLQMKSENFVVIDRTLRVRLQTVKGGIPREIELDIDSTPFMSDVIVPYVSQFQVGEVMFPGWGHPTNFNQIFKKIKVKSDGEIDINPNVFRHFRMSYLGYLGANMMQLKQWKGARSQESVEQYLGFRPVTEFKKAIR